MSFRLVPNSVTLDDFERRNGPYRRLISPNSVAFGPDYVKVVEDTPVLSACLVGSEMCIRDSLYLTPPPTEGFPWDDIRKNFTWMSADGQHTIWLSLIHI